MAVRYKKIALLLALITVVSIGLTALSDVRSPSVTEELSVVASFYPMYTAALNVVGDCEGVSVTCLTKPTTGCLHDYQMSPDERAVLESADVLVLNGAGMESFLEPTLASLSSVVRVDTSEGLAALTCEAHDHEHDHDHSVNAHVWIDPVRYAAQVQVICDELSKLDPLHAEEYAHNTKVYCEKIAAVGEQLHADRLPFGQALLFHESMAYTAEALRLSVIGEVPLGEDQAASAAELAEIAERLRGQSVLFLYDDQYPSAYTDLARYATSAASVRWNTAVRPISGVADRDAWLVAMQRNVQAVKEATA